jgi:hypothetical protein
MERPNGLEQASLAGERRAFDGSLTLGRYRPRRNAQGASYADVERADRRATLSGIDQSWPLGQKARDRPNDPGNSAIGLTNGEAYFI